MTTLAQTFKRILGILQHCPESESLEPLLADFAANIGAERTTLVYRQRGFERFLPVGAAVTFLAPYGIELRGDWKAGVRYIYAGVVQDEPSPDGVSSVHELGLSLEVAA
jgi:hypothetical protein